MALFTGVGGVARNVSNIYVGVGGAARRVERAYIGVGGVARQIYGTPYVPAADDVGVYLSAQGSKYYGDEYWVFSFADAINLKSGAWSVDIMGGLSNWAYFGSGVINNGSGYIQSYTGGEDMIAFAEVQNKAIIMHFLDGAYLTSASLALQKTAM